MKVVDKLRFPILLQQMSIAFVLAISVCVFSTDLENGIAHELVFFGLILFVFSFLWANSLILRIVLNEKKLRVHVFRWYKVEIFSFDVAEFNWELKVGFGAEGMRRTNLILEDNQSQLILNQKISGWSEKQIINALGRFNDVNPKAKNEEEG